MIEPTKHFYDFGPFRFDPEERVLHLDGMPVPLAPKVAETLSLLVQNAGHLVEKDELVKKVWPDTFVEEGNLNKNIFLLRRVLGQCEGGGEYIETVPRRGYRFVASVTHSVTETTSAQAGPLATSTRAERPTGSQSPPGGTRNTLSLHRTSIWSGAVLVGLAIALGAWLVRAHGSEALALVPAQLTSELGRAGEPSFSPDGNQIVYYQSPETGDNQSLYLKIIGVPGPPRRLTTEPGFDYSPAWSPDGRYIAFLRNRRAVGQKESVLRIPLTGGPEQTLADVSIWDAPFVWSVQNLAWFPDGQSLITVDRSSPEGPWGLFSLAINTRKKQKLTMPLPGAGNDANPAVSPDGHWLAFCRGMHLYIVELASDRKAIGEPRQITFEDGRQRTPPGRRTGERSFSFRVFLTTPAFGGWQSLKEERASRSGSHLRAMRFSRWRYRPSVVAWFSRAPQAGGIKSGRSMLPFDVPKLCLRSS